jgi:hypothetical protein
MARRGGRGRAGGGWWILAVLLAAVLVLWWMSARRAEAPGPPASVAGARALRAAPRPGESPAGGADGEEITPPEKRELERVLRERGAAPAR